MGIVANMKMWLLCLSSDFSQQSIISTRLGLRIIVSLNHCQAQSLSVSITVRINHCHNHCHNQSLSQSSTVRINHCQNQSLSESITVRINHSHCHTVSKTLYIRMAKWKCWRFSQYATWKYGRHIGNVIMSDSGAVEWPITPDFTMSVNFFNLWYYYYGHQSFLKNCFCCISKAFYAS